MVAHIGPFRALCHCEQAWENGCLGRVHACENLYTFHFPNSPWLLNYTLDGRMKIAHYGRTHTHTTNEFFYPFRPHSIAHSFSATKMLYCHIAWYLDSSSANRLGASRRVRVCVCANINLKGRGAAACECHRRHHSWVDWVIAFIYNAILEQKTWIFRAYNCTYHSVVTKYCLKSMNAMYYVIKLSIFRSLPFGLGKLPNHIYDRVASSFPFSCLLTISKRNFHII